MPQSVVDRLYSEFKQMVDQFGFEEISLRSTAEEIFQKSLLLAAASYFERRVKEDLLNYLDKLSGNTEIVTEFIRNKAIERQYHTFFSWDARNANTFFALFGEDFKKYMTDYVSHNEIYRDAILAFLELGRERNRLVHQDFGAHSVEKTTDEIYDMYTKALTFVDGITLHFEQYMTNKHSSINR